MYRVLKFEESGTDALSEVKSSLLDLYRNDEILCDEELRRFSV